MSETVPTSEVTNPPIVDNPNAPEVFFEGIGGVAVSSGIVKMNLVSGRFNPNGDMPIFSTVLRLAMPVASLATLRDGLTAVIDQWTEKTDD